MKRANSCRSTVAGALGLLFVLALSCRYSPDFSNTRCGGSEPRCPSGYTCDDSAAPPVCVSLAGTATGGHGGTMAGASGGGGGKLTGPASGGAGGHATGGGGAGGTTAGAAGQGGTAPGSGGIAGAMAGGSGGSPTGGAAGLGGKGSGGAPGSGGTIGAGGAPASGGTIGSGGTVGSGGATSGGAGAGGFGAGGSASGGATVPACGPSDTRCVNATDVQTCSDGQWGTTMTCTNACVGNACGGECRPGAKRCSTDTPQTCDQTGTWRDASSGACAPGLCAAGACLTTMNYGFTTGSAESLTPSNALIAIQVQLPAGVLVGLGFITTQSVGQHLYLGLYSDVSGHAGKLIQSSAELTAAVGTNEVAVTRTTVTAGSYWLVEVSDVSTHFASPGQSITIGIASNYTFDTLPMTIASPLPTTTGNAPDLYARVAN